MAVRLDTVGIHCVRANGAWIRWEARDRCLVGRGAVRLAPQLRGGDVTPPMAPLLGGGLRVRGKRRHAWSRPILCYGAGCSLC